MIAYGRGGILDTVVDGETGVFFNVQTKEALIDAVERFEASGLADVSKQACVIRAGMFTEQAFQDGIRRSLNAIGADAP